MKNQLPEAPAPIETMARAFYAVINPGVSWDILADAHKCRIRNGAALAYMKLPKTNER